jgi:hypothetical protein
MKKLCWTLKTWRKDIPSKKNQQLGQHKCLYLLHEQKGYVTTSQHKAWMDEVKMTMYVDTILDRERNIHQKLIFWMDNCPSHVTDFILEEMNAKQIMVTFILDAGMVPDEHGFKNTNEILGETSKGTLTGIEGGFTGQFSRPPRDEDSEDDGEDDYERRW